MRRNLIETAKAFEQSKHEDKNKARVLVEYGYRSVV